MDIIIGIDIGLTGALCFLDYYANDILSIYDMPVMNNGFSKNARKKTTLDIGRLNFILEIPTFHFESATVIIEDIHAFPGQGVISVGTLLEQKGIVRGLAQTLGYELVTVSPKTWQKHWNLVPPKGLKGKEPRKKWLKENSRLLASENYPEFSAKFDEVKSHGRSDACLIAQYYRDTYEVPSSPVKK